LILYKIPIQDFLVILKKSEPKKRCLCISFGPKDVAGWEIYINLVGVGIVQRSY
jgi:hypothetical protein